MKKKTYVTVSLGIKFGYRARDQIPWKELCPPRNQRD